jgi:hypothetical protein
MSIKARLTQVGEMGVVLPLGPGPRCIEAGFLVRRVQSGMVSCDQVPSLGLRDRRQVLLPGYGVRGPSRATSNWLTRLLGTGATRLPDKTTSIH